MKIIDKTPYRSTTGEIELVGRIQGMLKYGPSWHQRVTAQDAVIAILDKQLDSNYALLRNITLPNTEINLPLVLIGPPGIYMLNVLHERGIFIAKDDQWGKMIGDRFVPARINHISRTMTLGRVLQVYLDRQGFKGSVVVEPVLMASDPGMQIESTRPAVRVVMSDALERFAASMAQARPALDSPLAHDVAHSLLVGRPPKPAEPEPGDITSEPDLSSFGSFAFDDERTDSETDRENAQSLADKSPAAQAPTKAKKAASKKKGLLGLTTKQLLILGALLLFSLCAIAAATAFVLTNV